MLRRPFRFPLNVAYRDPSGPFGIDATLTAWRVNEEGTGGDVMVTLTIGSGTLHDADKGPCALDGLELTLRVAREGLEPVAVLNPGALSEFQQAGLLDAISNSLNDAERKRD